MIADERRTTSADPGPARNDAIAMREAARTDPQMRLPERPTMVPGTLSVVVDEAVVVDGGASRQIFRGSSAAQLLPRLFVLLDGTRSVPTVAAELGLPIADVEAAVALVHSCGLIIGSPDLPADVDPGAAMGVARLLDTTRTWSSAAEAYAGLRDRPLHVRATSSVTTEVARMLRESGDSVQMIAPHAALPPGSTVLTEYSGCDDLVETVEWATASDARAIPFGIAAGSTWVGPELGAPGTVCAACFARDVDELGIGVGDGRDADSEPLAASLVALEVFHQRIGIGVPLAGSSLVVHDLRAGSTRQFLVARSAGCRSRHRQGARTTTVSAPFWYDQSAAFPVRERIALKGHQSHYKPSNVALQWEQRAFVNARIVRFASDRSARPRGAAARLARFVRHGFGLKELPAQGRVRRFSPTGGNLGSSEAAVIVRRVAGIESGVYHYLPFSDSYAWMGEVPDELLSGLGEACDGDAVIVTTAAVDRVARKYAALSLKICLLDAGCALTQMEWTARDLGVRLTESSRWDDGVVARLLRHEGRRHPIMTIVGIEGLDAEEDGGC